MPSLSAFDLMDCEMGDRVHATAEPVADPPTWQLRITEITRTGAEVDILDLRSPDRGALSAYASGDVYFEQFGDPDRRMQDATRRRGGGPGSVIRVSLSVPQ